MTKKHIFFTFLIVGGSGRGGDVVPLGQSVGVPDTELLSSRDFSQDAVENLRFKNWWTNFDQFKFSEEIIPTCCKSNLMRNSPVLPVNPTLLPGFAPDCSWQPGLVRSSPTQESHTRQGTPRAPIESGGKCCKWVTPAIFYFLLPFISNAMEEFRSFCSVLKNTWRQSGGRAYKCSALSALLIIY